jgi:hypothetical protein
MSPETFPGTFMGLRKGLRRGFRFRKNTFSNSVSAVMKEAPLLVTRGVDQLAVASLAFDPVAMKMYPLNPILKVCSFHRVAMENKG